MSVNQSLGLGVIAYSDVQTKAAMVYFSLSYNSCHLFQQ